MSTDRILSAARHVLSELAPDHAAALLASHAAKLIQDLVMVVSSASHRRRGGDITASERFESLRERALKISRDIESLALSLLYPSIDKHVDALVERYPDYDDEHPTFRQAARAIAEDLTQQLDDGWEISIICPDGERYDRTGNPTSYVWAFAILSRDTTSYCSIDIDGAARIEWLGTAWEPGCECFDEDEHTDSCSAARWRKPQ